MMNQTTETLDFLLANQKELREEFSDPRDPEAFKAFQPHIVTLLSVFPLLGEKYKKMEETLEKIKMYDVPFENDNTMFLECREEAEKALAHDPLANLKFLKE